MDSYDENYKRLEVEWKKRHPNQDYGEYIDGLINEQLES